MNVTPTRAELARRLFAANHDAGVHPEHGVVIYYSERIWSVAGGDVERPSLLALAGVRLAEVRWIAPRSRREPRT